MKESHPYGDYIPKGTTSLIIGSFPIAKFSDPARRHEIKEHEFDFYFGGERNLLWKLLAATFKVDLSSTSKIKKFLKDHHFGIADVIVSCRRKNGGASDSDLYDIEWNRGLIRKIERAEISTLYFTSKKVEGWFNKLFPNTEHLKKISLISPSAQVVRSLVRMKSFHDFLRKNTDAKPFDFILEDYKQKFISDA